MHVERGTFGPSSGSSGRQALLIAFSEASVKAMPEWTAEQIAQTAFDRDLIDEQNLRELWGEVGTGQVDPKQFQQLLLRRELVTNYQLQRLLRGDRYGYFYGPYKVLYKVGSGTFSRVYRAVHRETGEVRAVKVLRAELHIKPEEREQFIREGELGRTLRHPNIVPIYEVDSDNYASWIVMDFIEGRNLRQFIKIRTRLEVSEALRLALDICRGLDYAYKRGISHRDLKASNVLISSLGQAKLLDFGLAGADPNVSDADLEEVENPRTIDYVALERFTGVRNDDSRSDVFFFGCILYHMLSGVPALEETTDRRARMSRNRFDAMVPIQKHMPDLPWEVANVVNKATMVDPTKRYQSPTEMLGELIALGDRNSGENGKTQKLGSAPVKSRAVMIVEPTPQIQEALRNHFKQEGFRVLVTADAQRPASLFTDTNAPADIVVFSTSGLGEEALNAFNEFGDLPATKSVPAILLLGPKHLDWASRAKTNDWRTTVGTPIKWKRLLALFEKIMPAEKV